MKKSLWIAQLELKTLFYSPIAWFLLIVLLFQCGLAYTTSLEGFVTQFEQYGGRLPSLTGRIFGGSYGMYYMIMEKLYLYLPLLTMGLISREVGSGTIKLLYSSPVKIREIVFGKFLAMMVYDFLLLLVLAIFAFSGLIQIRGVDYGLLLSGLLGIYLLLCAYSAIGLFLSSLTTYQVVAAIGTLVLFAVLRYIGTVWQGIDFVRDLTYFLSISGRTEKMLGGLITTRDVLYFVVIVYMFLGFTVCKLREGRESVSGFVRTGRYALITLSALLIGYLSARPGFVGYLDATATGQNTLSEHTQKIIRGLDAPLEVTSYINLLDGTYGFGTPEQRNADLARWEDYQRFKPDIRLRYVYYYDSTDGIFKFNPGLDITGIARKYARELKVDLQTFKRPEEIRKVADLAPEFNRYVMQLRYKDKTTFLRLYDDLSVFPGETETAAALKRLTVKLPRIAFLTGDLERSIFKSGDRDYETLTSKTLFRYALVNQGFDVDTVSSTAADIPPGITALVIADPRVALGPGTQAMLRRYIDRGGNLLVSGEPGKQSVLNPVLKSLGVQLMEGTLVQHSKNFSPDLVLPYLTATAAGFSRQLKYVFDDSMRVSMPGAAGLSYDSTGLSHDGDGAYTIKPLLMTDGNRTWNKKSALVADSAEVVFSARDGDEKGSFPTAVCLTRQRNGKEQRIIVTGDADFLSNAELGRNNVRTANFSFITALFGWFTYGVFPIDTSRPRPKDDSLRITEADMGWLKVIYLGILPGLLLLTGAILLIRRKRR
jgi:ABC-2 type transport system permease protein